MTAKTFFSGYVWCDVHLLDTTRKRK